MLDASLRTVTAIAVAIAIVAASAVSAQAQVPPNQQAYGTNIPLGVSGSSQEYIIIKNRIYCYAGTFGSLGEDEAGTYVISNNHILARQNEAVIGENMIQPGLLDSLGPSTCSYPGSANAGDVVGTLEYFVPLQLSKRLRSAPENTVDAAIALVSDVRCAGTTGCFRSNGEILGIGAIATGIAAPSVGLAVQKSGRTTGHTTGSIIATDADIIVSYDSGYGRFRGQIHVENTSGGNFSAGGDSGSQIVTDPASGAPQAVGLLYAGGGAATFANPMSDVLNALAIDMFGCNSGASCTVGAAADRVSPPAEEEEEDSGGPPSGRGGGRFSGAEIPLGLQIAMDVKARNSDRLYAIEGVVGHSVSIGADGNPEILVYSSDVARRGLGQSIPTELEGIQVRVVETGPIVAY